MGAQARADGATHPRIELRNLADLEAMQTWPEVAHRLLRERACPNPNCLDEVPPLREWPAEQDGIATMAGYCDSCGTLAVECPECGEVTALDVGSTTKCDACEVTFESWLWPGEYDPDTITVNLPAPTQ